MFRLNQHCQIYILSETDFISDFDCGDEELNEFFNNKALPFKNQLLAKTCFFRHNETGKIVCAFSISPNALKAKDLPNSRQKKVKQLVPFEKNLQSYPAFLVGRLGVSKEFNGQGIGSQLLDYIKGFCLDNYPDFCRFLVVDAYNSPSVISFYLKSGFAPVFSSEEQERKTYKINPNEKLPTRYLFYDMLRWKDNSMN